MISLVTRRRQITSKRYMGWMQAGVFHAYQIFKRRELKDENIVVFMYNDTAKSELNPRPGVIINHLNGSYVYVGVPKRNNLLKSHEAKIPVKAQSPGSPCNWA